MPAKEPTKRASEVFTAEGVWIASTALRTGGDPAEDSSVDMCLARDASGDFYILGSSIAGAARSHLARFRPDVPEGESPNRAFNPMGNSAAFAGLEGFARGDEPKALWSLFGGYQQRASRRNAFSTPVYGSLLTVREARLDGPAVPSIRDGVKLEAKSGLAEDKAKFDSEVLPTGVRFRLRFELWLPEDLPHSGPDGVDRTQLLQQFRWLLDSFSSGRIRLGARTRRGLGQGRVENWDVCHYDLKQAASALAWLKREPRPTAIDDLGNQPLPKVEHRFSIRARFHLTAPLLIRGRAANPNSPDFVHFQDAAASWMTGTAFAGSLRSRVRRIAALFYSEGDYKKVNDRLFGMANVKGEEPVAGRLTVTESRLAPGGLRVQSRVAIDRFTGGALETALFDEAPFWPDPSAEAHWETELSIDAQPYDEIDQRSLRLILAAFKDLWLEDLPIGGEAGVGRGIARGVSAVFSYLNYPDLKIERTGAGAVLSIEGWSQDWAALANIPSTEAPQ